MMTINAMSYLKKLIPNAEFTVEMDSELDVDRLNAELDKQISFEVIESVKQYKSRIKLLSDLKRLFGFNTQAKKIKKINPDLIVYLGGDDFSEYYSKIKVTVELFWSWIFSKKHKSIFLGHTMGPFTSWRKGLFSKFLSKSIILSRDELSAKHLKNDLGLNNVITSHDLAFLDLPLQERKHILKRYDLTNNQYITLIPSGLSSHYTESHEDYITGWCEIIKSILQNQKLENKKILLFAHVIKEHEVDDRDIIEELISKIKKDNTIDSGRIITITDLLLASEARCILGNSYFTISGRMHGTVSTFQMGKPAIALSYSVKYQGVIGGSLKRKDLVIEAKDNNLWESGKIIDEVDKKINYIVENKINLEKEIQQRVKVMKEELKQVIKKIVVDEHR